MLNDPQTSDNNQIAKLIEENKNLTKKCNQLRTYVATLQEHLALEILQHLSQSKSIRKTQELYCYEDVKALYWDIKYFNNGSCDEIYSAKDYRECKKELFSDDEDEDDEEDNEEDDEEDDDGSNDNKQKDCEN